MAIIDVTVKFKNGAASLLMVGIGGEILRFDNSKTLSVELDPKTYLSTVIGLLDPNDASTVEITFKQEGNVLANRIISDKKFIRKQFVIVKP